MISRSFAAAIGVSFMIFGVKSVSRREAAAIGVFLIILEKSGCLPPLRGGNWSIFHDFWDQEC
ncbi:hypothetical protein TYRP_014694 [Tyrophagus putrescentiae]|nr:hypothetical protein TYRP_014694 [Tyrophagus putrescentiae]